MSWNNQQKQFSQPTCKNCGENIDWNKQRREALWYRGPLNLDGTIHKCIQAPQQQQQQQQSQQQQSNNAPNPSGYTGSSSDYQHPPQQQNTITI